MCYMSFFTKDINETPIPPNFNTRIYQTKESIEQSTIMTRHTSKFAAKVKENVLSRPSKRKQIILKSKLVPELEPGIESDEEKKERDKLDSNEKLQNLFSKQTFWDSSKVRRWFVQGEKDKNMKDTISQTIERLKNTYIKSKG